MRQEQTPLSVEQQRRGMRALGAFAILNSFSFETISGQILILFARQVGASVRQIGILSSFLPLSSLIQVAVTPLVNTFGPKAIMAAGWTARTVVAVALLFVPAVTERYGAPRGTFLLLAVMLLYHLCRALGVSSWPQLLQDIVPLRLRGKFLSRQELLRQIAVVSVSILTAGYLFGNPSLERFLHIIGAGVGAAFISLIFAYQVPHIPPSGKPALAGFWQRTWQPLRDIRFRQYLAFSITLKLALTALPTFVIVFLRDRLHLSPTGVLFFTCLGNVGAMSTLSLWGRVTDRYGCKPIIGLCLPGMCLVPLGWAGVTSTPLGTWGWGSCVSFWSGLVSAGLYVATSKYELGIIPREERAHYVALSVMSAGLAGGLSSRLAGEILERLQHLSWHLGGYRIDNFRLFFLGTFGLSLIPLFLRRGLREENVRSARSLVKAYVRQRSRRWRERGKGG